MEKNWLIRTKNLKILGPVSSGKIIELVEKGSLTYDDEICAGNGFWFSVKEREYLQKYLIGNEIQPFNPLSDAGETMGRANSPSISDCVNFPIKGNIVADAAKKILSEHFDHESSPDVTKLTNLADFFKPNVNDRPKPKIPVLPVDTQEKKDESDLPEEEEEVVVYPENNDLEFPSIFRKGTQPIEGNNVIASNDGSGMIFQLDQEKIALDDKPSSHQAQEFEVDIGVLLIKNQINVSSVGESASVNGKTPNSLEKKLKDEQSSQDDEIEEDILLPSADDLEFPTMENIEAVKRGEKIPETVKTKVQEVLVDLKKTIVSEVISQTKNKDSQLPVSQKAQQVQDKEQKNPKKKVSKKSSAATNSKKNANRRKGGNNDSVPKILVLVGTAIVVLFLLLRFTDVLANDFRTLDIEKKKILDFPPIINGEIILSGKMGPEGFVFERFDQEIGPIDCTKVNDFYYQMKLMLNSSFTTWGKVNSLFAICPNIRSDALIRIEYLKQKIGNVKELEKYLKSNHFEKNKIKKIQEIYLLKQKLILQKDYVDEFINTVRRYSEKKEKSVHLDKELGKLSKKYPGTMTSFYFSLLSFWQVGNYDKVKDLIKEIISVNPLEFVFKNEVVAVMDRQKINEYVASVTKLFKILESEMRGKIEFQMLLNYFSLVHDTLELYELKKRNNCDWSMEKTREMIKSINFGLPYFSLWISLLRSYDEAVASDYVYKSVDITVMNKLDKRALWPFSIIEIDEMKISQVLTDRISKELDKNKTALDEYVIINFLYNPQILQQLKLENPAYNVSVTRIEHDFFRKILDTGLAIEFAIYQLVRRNDLDDEYLWWLIL